MYLTAGFFSSSALMSSPKVPAKPRRMREL